jgi:flagellar hook-associated protein 1 FlgK
MSTLFSILNLGSSALAAAQAGVKTAGDNVANVGTPGYARRELVQSSGLPYQVGRLQLGSGVSLDGIRRATSGTLERRVRDGASAAEGAGTRASVLGRTTAVLDEVGGAGMGGALDELFASFEGLAAAPQDRAARTRALAAGERLAGALRSSAEEVSRQRADLDQDVEGEVRAVNRATAELARLNRQISGSQPAAPALLDRQAALLEELSGTVSISVRRQANGTVDVGLAGTGSSLVAGEVASTLSTAPGPDGLLRVSTVEAGLPRDVTGALGAGRLGGLLRARDGDLGAVGAALDDLAFRLAGAFNAVHAVGVGADGVTGRNLFAAPAAVAGAAANLRLDPAVAGNPDALAAATDATRLPGDNSGALALAELRDRPVVNGQRPGDALRGVLAGLADRVADADRGAVAARDALAATEAMQDAAIGVSVDEEMTNLIRFRQAYAAAAQVVRTADELVQEVLTLKR